MTNIKTLGQATIINTSTDEKAAYALEMPVINVTPYDHQKRAFKFICNTFGLLDGDMKSNGAALLMEMGTGKTLVSVAAAGALYKKEKITRALVVAPLSVLGVWRDEFRKFASFPYQMALLNKGSKEKNKKELQSLSCEGLQIALINYEGACMLADDGLAEYNADLVIADEGHKIKNGMTKRSKAMHAIGDQARYKLLLTGTPITNKELDIFSQYRFINPKIFGKWFLTFRDEYFRMGGYQNHEAIFLEEKKEAFSQKIYSVAFRATKSECLDLPETRNDFIRVALEPKARKYYDDLVDEYNTSIKDADINANNVLTQLLRLSQITGGYLTDNNGNTISVSKAKINALAEIIDTITEEGKKLVVMVRFLAEFKAIEELLENKKIGYASVCGSTENRDEEVQRFQTNSKCQVFVGQMQTAGLGITLTAAATMVFYSLDYSMANFDQAKARIHRAGQTEKCQYLYLIAENSIDEQVLQALEDKVDLAKKLIDDYRNNGKALFATIGDNSPTRSAA